jgi:hypothetical protein
MGPFTFEQCLRGSARGASREVKKPMDGFSWTGDSVCIWSGGTARPHRSVAVLSGQVSNQSASQRFVLNFPRGLASIYDQPIDRDLPTLSGYPSADSLKSTVDQTRRFSGSLEFSWPFPKPYSGPLQNRSTVHWHSREASGFYRTRN